MLGASPWFEEGGGEFGIINRQFQVHSNALCARRSIVDSCQQKVELWNRVEHMCK
jgi:hypothetical protein